MENNLAINPGMQPAGFGSSAPTILSPDAVRGKIIGFKNLKTGKCIGTDATNTSVSNTRPVPQGEALSDLERVKSTGTLFSLFFLGRNENQRDCFAIVSNAVNFMLDYEAGYMIGADMRDLNHNHRFGTLSKFGAPIWENGTQAFYFESAPPEYGEDAFLIRPQWNEAQALDGGDGSNGGFLFSSIPTPERLHYFIWQPIFATVTLPNMMEEKKAVQNIVVPSTPPTEPPNNPNDLEYVFVGSQLVPFFMIKPANGVAWGLYTSPYVLVERWQAWSYLNSESAPKDSGGITHTTTVTVGMSTEDSRTFSINVGFQLTETVGAEAEIEGVGASASTSVTFSLSLDWSWTHSNTYSKETTISDAYSILPGTTMFFWTIVDEIRVSIYYANQPDEKLRVFTKQVGSGYTNTTVKKND